MEWLLMLIISALVAILSAIAMFKFGYKRFIAWELLFGGSLFAIGIIFGSIGIINNKTIFIQLAIGLFLISAILMSIPSMKSYRHRNDVKEYQKPSLKSKVLGRVIEFPPPADKAENSPSSPRSQA